jgi:HAD superfamily hydrolase (TIGR01450 family)
MGFGKGARSHHLMPKTMMNADWAFQAYESVRARLPNARFDNHPVLAADLDEIADQFDVFLLDAFGVLNVGERPIAGAPERIAALQAAGKEVMVITNAASYPKRLLIDRYARLGFHFTPDNVVSSRETLLTALAKESRRHWGLMAQERYANEEFEALDFTFLSDNRAEYDRAEGFLLFGSGDWSDEYQRHLVASLTDNPRPVLVGNPDIVAPRETGLSKEPGFFAHELAEKTGVSPVFYGKPFPHVFQRAFARLPHGVDPARVLMVGDTLHTDILGGRAAGVRTALITDFGSLTGLDVQAAITRSGITPDFILPQP